MGKEQLRLVLFDSRLTLTQLAVLRHFGQERKYFYTHAT